MKKESRTSEIKLESSVRKVKVTKKKKEEKKEDVKKCESFADRYYKFRQAEYKKHQLNGLFLEVTSRCNARCEHCGSSCGDFVPKDEITKDELIGVLDDVANHYDPKKIMLFVTGGEPLVRKDLFEIMDYASRLGFYWGMTTNGILIDENVVDKMAATNMATVSVSIDGVKETHESFRKVPGSFEKIIKGLKLMLKCPVIKDVQVTTCVNKKNIDQLEEIYKIVKEIGIKNWRLIEVDPIGRAKGNTDLLLDGYGMKRMFAFMYRKRLEDPEMKIGYGCGHFFGLKLNRFLTGSPYMCYTGYWVASILSNGDIFGCPDIERLPELIEGNIRKDSFVDVWEHGFKRYRKMDRTSNKKCKSCPDWKLCLGDAFHTWDFKNNRPNFCKRELFEEDLLDNNKKKQKESTKKTKKESTKKAITKKPTKNTKGKTKTKK